jgi:polysaccharide export outer membrane protein
MASMRTDCTVAVLILIALTTATPAAAQPARANGNTAPAATAAVVPVPNDFVIGPEDVLGVLFWREADISGDVTVRPDGIITVPLLGEIKAAGMRPDALREHIQESASKYLTDANVAVVVRQINSRKVFITGMVSTPGAYPLTGPRTVMQLIALAGGLVEYAESENITIMRQGNQKTQSFKFNYKDVAKGKKLEQNIALLPGDTVVVP